MYITANNLPQTVIAAVRTQESLVWIDRYIAIVDALLATHPDEDAYGHYDPKSKAGRRYRSLKH